jgi:hypothetical protein
VTDVLTLIGLVSFPAYSVYWILYQRRRGRRSLWPGLSALLLWCAATYWCFLRLMLGCLGGHCGDQVSPFLELAIVYAGTSAALIVLLHWKRATGRNRAGASRD